MADPGEEPRPPPLPLLMFRPNWGPKGQKNFWRPGPTLSQDLDDRPRPPHPSPIWRSGSTTGRYGIGSLFAMGGKLWASLRSIPSWKSNLCCMLDTNVHWFVCLFVCLFLEDKKKNKDNDICSWVKWLVSNYQNLYLAPTLRGIKQNKWSINT